MAFIQLKIPLLPPEREALNELAILERRRIEAQAAWIIHTELERRGLLKPENQRELIQAGCNGK